MKKIEIIKVDNGYIVQITYEGVQSIYEQETSKVAKTKHEVIGMLEKELE